MTKIGRSAELSVRAAVGGADKFTVQLPTSLHARFPTYHILQFPFNYFPLWPLPFTPTFLGALAGLLQIV